ncbi:MAG: phosphatidylserine decarboxylase [Chlamydiia bacterium]|nr:phosphatidylserine decarboxylase [Chlamydiia bacterium]
MIVIYNRQTKQNEVEKVYGETTLKLFLTTRLIHFIARLPLLSRLFGWWQRQPWTARKIAPFIKKYGIDASEFDNTFPSFDAFFSRPLKPNARTFPKDPKTAIIPADGRYWFFPDLNHVPSLFVKGQHFDLPTLLQDRTLAHAYQNGSCVLGRLCPSDYHRFHFPCSGIPHHTKEIPGPLFPVNPLAVRQRLSILTENRRTLTPIDTDDFGTLLMIEIGATCVGTIHQTFTPNTPIQRGAEKGYFSFGGSALILLFPPQAITFAPDLVNPSCEILCRFGEPLSFFG